MNLSRSGENYLEAMLIMQLQKGEIRSSDVAAYLRVTKASVCCAVSILKDGGFVTMDPRREIYLTESGLQAAERVYERHCVIREALIRLGVDPETAEQDARRTKLDLSEQTFEKLKSFLEKKNEISA